jgi:nucleotide-binding universal stress UspA family protein
MNATMKHGSVVVGVDGSAGSDAALEWAVQHAVTRRKPLLIVNGAGDPSHISEFVDATDARRILRTAARRLTDHALGVVRRRAPGLEVEVTTPLHDARQALLDVSDRASMIVVGTRGRGPVKALMLGSVSTAVAEHSSCPVAVVRPALHHEGGPEGDGPPAHVAVGIDGSAASTPALGLAFDLASTEGRPLDVVHSWSNNDTFIDRTSYEQRLERLDDHYRLLTETLSGYAEKYPDVPVDRLMPDSGAVQTLVGLSEKASVVVVGSHGKTGVRAVLGSVSRAVAERAHCTVVVVPS